MKIVFRPNYSSLEEWRLQHAINKIEYTLYQSWSKDYEAPEKTDCITAIRWILQQSSDFKIPHEYIGVLPNTLLQNGQVMIKPLKEARLGDLIFFENFSKTHNAYMVTHIWLMIRSEEFIHSSKKWNGRISSIHDWVYSQNILSESFLKNLTDPRNNQIL